MRTLPRILVYIGLIIWTGNTALAAKESGPGRRTITISEINLNWFGLGGSPTNPNGEHRAPTIRQYFIDHNLLADVMVFEEIVDQNLLQQVVLANAYACHSYLRKDLKHQHVVICNKSEFTFDKADDSPSYALETVDTSGHLRPAVHGVLKDSKGTRLLHIFGVHLKAMPDKSAVRILQAGKIKEYLAGTTVGEPTVILGDFNTFGTDPENIEQVFSSVNLTESQSAEPFTWASASENFDPAKFDRAWISHSLESRVLRTEVVGPCSSGDSVAIAQYNLQVSDHCAVSMTIEIGG